VIEKYDVMLKHNLHDLTNTVRAACSWNPDKPAQDKYGSQGGRIMMTSFCALTLEVYYRYMPLYKLEMEEETVNPVGAENGEVKPAVKTENSSEKIETVG
jgi:hypothetical protein